MNRRAYARIFGRQPLRALLDEACDQFEAACQKAGSSGPLPRIEEYVAGVAGPERGRCVQELIPLDMHYRRQRGETPQPEEYRSRFPDLDPQWLTGAVEAFQVSDCEAKSLLHTGPWQVAVSRAAPARYLSSRSGGHGGRTARAGLRGVG